MSAPLLVKMSDATFAGLRNEAVPRSIRRKNPSPGGSDATECIFIGYCERLLYANQALRNACKRHNCGVTGSKCWSQLTRGQRILYCLCALDGDVKNGGIAQFLWNHPELLHETGASLRSIGEATLVIDYDHVVELVGTNRDWLRIRRRFEATPKDLQPFQSSRELFDLSWFDDAYLRQFSEPLQASVIQYVEEQKHEFIEP